jgi:hypothetical protein
MNDNIGNFLHSTIMKQTKLKDVNVQDFRKM